MMLTHRLPDGRIPVVLSAHDPELVRREASAVADYLGRVGNSADLTAAVASTLLHLRKVRRHRAVVRAADSTELLAGLAAIAGGEDHELVSHSARTTPPRLAFVFPGQGNQWQAMGADAYRRLPAYREAADRCAHAFTTAEFPSPLPYLVSDDARDWSRPEIQGAQFTHAVSLAEAWRSCGVLPDVTIGHSLGELAAAYVAETISLPDAVKLVIARATVIDRLTGSYAMAVLGTGLDTAESLLTEAPGWLEVSAVNGPSSTVVAGDHPAVTAVVRLAQQRGIFGQQLSVDYPGHTSALRPLRERLAELTPRSMFRDGPVRFIGSTLGAEPGATTDFSEYWYENLCGTVRFDRAVQSARACGADAFVELSAHPSLLYPLGDVVEDDSTVIVGSGHRDRTITESLSAGLAAVAIADPGCRWTDAVPRADRPALRGFPNAPMRAVYLWAAPERLTEVAPEPALTVGVEGWRPTTAPLTQNSAATDIGFAGTGPLTRRLAEAVAAHGSCREVPSHDAEVVVVAAAELDQLDATAAIEEIAARSDAGLPDYPALIGPRCRAVWLLTAGAEQITDDDANVSPAQAALAGMHRSVGFEFPDQAFGHLDLEHRDVDPATARAAVEVLLGEAAEIALRGPETPRRLVRTFRTSCESAPRLDAAALDDVVITGGSGAIGLQYARYCLKRGARTVTLLSRNGVDPAVLSELADGYDAEVRAPRCDITDHDAVAAVAANSAGPGASLLIHAAGIARALSRSDLTGADVAAVCAAKVRGLAVLADMWPLRPDCRILACSSVFGVWGGYMHAAYAASNRMLDVLAAQLRATGRDCTAIRWGLWQGAGVVGGDEITRTERSGLVAMEPERAIEASLRRQDGDPLIFDADFDRLRVFFESQSMPMPFTTARAAEDEDREGPVERPLAEIVRAELAATLHVGDSLSIDLGASLIDLGVDSLLALDLRKRLRRTVGNSVPVSRMLGGITVTELIDTLRADSAGGPAAPLGRAAATSGAHHPTLAMLERLDS